MKMVYGIIINQSSGSVSDQTETELAAILNAARLTYKLKVVPGNTMAATAQTLLAEGCSALVAGGGDGSLASVAKEAIKANVPFGVLPLGTLNHFAKDLDIPSDLAGAVQTLADGKTRQIDYASVNGNIILNNSSVGLYPELVFRREDREQRIGKWPAAALSLADIFSKPLKCLRLQISVDGKLRRVLTPCVFIGNNDYGIDRFGINQRASITQGELSLFIFAGRQRRIIFWHLVRILVGKPHTETAIVESAQKIEISGRQKFDVAIDGEALCLAGPLTYQIHPLALTVIAPKK